MKISSASKKVLASALSAAMVVAFAPTVAFGAQAGQTIKVTYNTSEGVDTLGGYQTGLTVKDAAVTSYSNKAGAVTLKYAVAAAAPAADSTVWKDTVTTTATTDKIWLKVVDATAGVTIVTELGNALAAATNETPTAAVTYVAGTATEPAASSITGASAATTDEDKPYQWVKVTTTTATATPAKDIVVGYQAFLPTTAADGNAWIALESGAGLKLASGTDQMGNDTKYSFKTWKLGYDINGDGDFTDDDEYAVATNGLFADVKASTVESAKGLTAYAVYDAPSISASTLTINNKNTAKNNAATGTFDVACSTSGALDNHTYTVSLKDPSGTVVAAKTAAQGTMSFADVVLTAGTYTAEISDGVLAKPLATAEFKIGALELDGNGGVFTGRDGLNTTAQSVFFNNGVATTYGAILTGVKSTLDLSAGKKINGADADNVVGGAAKFFVAGVGVVDESTVANVDPKAVTTKLSAYYAAEVGINAFTYDNGTFTVGVTGATMDTWTGSNWGTGGQYYLTITDSEGKLVAESVDLDGKAGNDMASAGAGVVSWTFADATAEGAYTATLYKTTKGTNNALTDGAAAGTTAVATKTVEVAKAAAPSWSYTSDADGKGGVLTLTNNAGSDYKVTYNGVTYDETKGGIKVVGGTTNYTVVATAKDAKTKPAASKTIVLKGYGSKTAGALGTFETFVNNTTKKNVNESLTVYYSQADAVKAAVAAAEKTSPTQASWSRTPTAPSGTPPPSQLRSPSSRPSQTSQRPRPRSSTTASPTPTAP